jgi:hypothetical protein
MMLTAGQLSHAGSRICTSRAETGVVQPVLQRLLRHLFMPVLPDQPPLTLILLCEVDSIEEFLG